MKNKKEIFKELGMEELKKEEINSWNEKYYEQYLQLKASGEKEYLFYRIKELKKKINIGWRGQGKQNRILKIILYILQPGIYGLWLEEY